MKERLSHPLSPEHDVRTLIGSRAYGQYARGETTRRDAVQHAAIEQRERLSSTKEGYESRDAVRYKVIASVNDFADASLELDQQLRVGAPRRERLPTLEKIVRFNHAVKELINGDRNLGFNEITTYITQMYGFSNQDELRTLDPEDRKNQLIWFKEHARTVLSGMRHELAAEQIIGAVPDRAINVVYFDELSDEEHIQRDLEGKDITVDVHGVIIDLDIKSTERAAQTKNNQRSYGAPVALASGVDSVDFGGKFFVPHTVVERQASVMQAQLLYLSEVPSAHARLA